MCGTRTEKAPASDVNGPWYSLDYTFTMEPGSSKLPRPPITGKAEGERPKIPLLRGDAWVAGLRRGRDNMKSIIAASVRPGHPALPSEDWKIDRTLAAGLRAEYPGVPKMIVMN